MFAVAAVGVTALAGYGVYRYISSRNERLRTKKAVDDMVRFLLLPLSRFPHVNSNF